MKKTFLLLTIVALTGCADRMDETATETEAATETETETDENIGEVNEAFSFETKKVGDGLAFDAAMKRAQEAITKSVILAGGATQHLTGAPIASPEQDPAAKKASPRDPSTKQTRKP